MDLELASESADPILADPIFERGEFEPFEARAPGPGPEFNSIVLNPSSDRIEVNVESRRDLSQREALGLIELFQLAPGWPFLHFIDLLFDLFISGQDPQKPRPW